MELIKQKVDEQLELIQLGVDVNIGLQKFFVNLLPTFILQPFFRLISILSASGYDLTLFGLPRYSYGTAIICNYGKDGLENTFLPLFPFSYSPIILGISKIKEYNLNKYGDNQGNDEKHYKCKFCYTIDHRYLNERIVAKLLNDINSTILNPQQVYDEVYFQNVLILVLLKLSLYQKLNFLTYKLKDLFYEDLDLN